MDEVIAKVRGFVARETNTDFESLLPETRLHSDLGLDGPQAVEFIERFSARFGVDVEDLWTHWKQYFSTEGTTLGGVMLLVAIAVGVYFTGRDLFPSVAWWIVLPVDLLFVGYLATLIARRHSSRPDRKEITLADLVHAVKQGRLRLR